MEDERRKFVRLDLNTMVEWEKLDSAEPSGEFVSKNISSGGICLIVNDTINIGDKLKLKISLPTLKKINSNGKVVWVEDFEIVGERREKRYEAGIEFFGISDEDREEINKFVFRLLRSNLSK
jgi:c-di-GMP-binding flagellar brake protein YcgR